MTHASMFSAGIPMVVDSGHSILLIIRCCQSWNNSLKEREYQISIQCRKPSSRESALNSFRRRTLSRLIFDWRCQSETMPLTWQTDTRFMLPRTVELRCYKHSIAFMCHWENSDRCSVRRKKYWIYVQEFKLDIAIRGLNRKISLVATIGIE